MTDLTSRACTACAAANPAGARFCGSCGMALTAGSASAPKGPPNHSFQAAGLAQPQPPLASGFSGIAAANANAAPHAQTLAPMGIADAFAHVAQRLTAAGAEVVSATPPHALAMRCPVHAFTGKIDPKSQVRYRADIQLAAQPDGRTAIQARFAVEWRSLLLFVGIAVVANLVLMAMAGANGQQDWATVHLILAVIAPIVVWFEHTGRVPRKAGEALLTLLAGEAPGPAAAPAQSSVFSQAKAPIAAQQPAPAPFPTPAPAMQAPAPQAAAPQSAPTSALAVLQELAQMRDAGLITAAEFEAKKADLLARL